MHYLSHFYYELPAKSPLFTVGLGIPDLAPGFSKAYNSAIKNSVLTVTPPLDQIHEGILSHYAADKAFHNSPVFMNLVSLTTQSFLAAGLNRARLRLSVISHVAVEMMIDRQIMMENGQLVTDYYTLINNADEKLISDYFDLFSLEETKRKFFIRFQFFKQRRFLLLFTDPANIAEGLSRMYKNLVGFEFTEEEKNCFFNALNNIDSTIRYSWKEILNAKVYE
jgi:hypothetical protein